MVRIESLILEFRLAAAARPLHSELFWVLFCLVNLIFSKLTNSIHYLLRVNAKGWF